MSISKRVKLDPDQFTMFHGKETHEIEMPYAEDIDLWVEWFADRDVCVWLYFTSGKRVPFASALKGHFNVKTSNVLSVVLQSPKSATILACVSYKDLAVTDKLDYTPVEIAPPPPAQLQLSSLMDEAIRRRLSEMGIPDKLEVTDEDNLEDEEDDEGFGEGYMEDEEPGPRKPASAKKPRPGDSAPDGGVGVEPAGGAGAGDAKGSAAVGGAPDQAGSTP